MRPSFVVVKVDYEDQSGKGLYDAGANASAISLRALQKIKDHKFIPRRSTYNTTSGKGVILGVTMLTISILDVTERVVLYVLDDSSSFNYHSKCGHVGSKHVLAIISRNFTFPGMYKHVTSYTAVIVPFVFRINPVVLGAAVS